MRTTASLLLAITWATLAVAQTREVNVLDFGATMDGVTDDTAAFQAALDAVPDRGVVEIPAGTAVLSKTLVLTNKTVVLRGQGGGVTRLLWQEPGGLHLVETRTWNDARGRKASWDVRDVAFVTSAVDGGTALYADFATSDRLDPALVVRDCRFEALGAKAYWTKSIHGHNAHLGRIVGCTFRGSASPESTTAAHIHLNGNSTSFVIDSCHGMNSTYGVLVEGETEGVTIDKCFFVHNRYGYVLNITEGGEPMFDVVQSHAASGVYPLWIKNGRSSSIMGNCFILQRCSTYKDGPTSREGIRIEGRLAKDVIVSACTVQITDKEFSGAFTGIHAVSGRGIIVANNTVANNSGTTLDQGIVIGDEVRGAVCAGNIFHLKTETHVSVSPDAEQVQVDGMPAGSANVQ